MNTHRPGWQPPHCPNPNCKYHNQSHQNWRFKRKGFYTRLAAPQRIQRFTCLHCRRTFSSQTFSTTYWLKNPDRLRRVFSLLTGGMANRQIARTLRCSPHTVQHLCNRLGRHCILFHNRQMQQLGPTAEMVVDGFETFEWSQYFPFHHNVAVDVATGFFLYHTDSPLRRKGRMTVYQRQRRQQLEDLYGRPDPQAVRKGMRELLQEVTDKATQVIIRSDDHRSYPAAMRALDCKVVHRVTPGREHRDRRNALWEVNLLDLLIRHGTAAHRRETIAWSKRRQASALKLAVFQVWRNNIKRRWEKGPAVSPAMLRGLTSRLLQVKDVLKRRLFRTRMILSQTWSRYYDGAVETPAVGVNRRHELKYAY